MSFLVNNPQGADEKRQQMRAQLTQMMMGGQPTTTAGGIGALVGALGNRYGDLREQTTAFPPMPGGGQPSIGLADFLGFGRSGGLY